jgi:hypothetical protein
VSILLFLCLLVLCHAQRWERHSPVPLPVERLHRHRRVEAALRSAAARIWMCSCLCRRLQADDPAGATAQGPWRINEQTFRSGYFGKSRNGAIRLIRGRAGVSAIVDPSPAADACPSPGRGAGWRADAQSVSLLGLIFAVPAIIKDRLKRLRLASSATSTEPVMDVHRRIPMGDSSDSAIGGRSASPAAGLSEPALLNYR